MKKHLLAVAAIAAFLAPEAIAQQGSSSEGYSPIRKGNVSIGTRIGLAELSRGSAYNGESGIQYNVSFTPSIGYFISDNWLLFASANGAASGMTYGILTSSKSVGIGLGGRYYFGNAVNSKSEVNRLRFYVEAGANLQQGWSKIEIDSATRRAAAYGIDFRGGAGFNYLLNENVALESGLSYNRNLYNSLDLGYHSNIRMELGVRVFLKRNDRHAIAENEANAAGEQASARPASPISKGHFSIGTNLGVGQLLASRHSDKIHLDYALALNPSAGCFFSDHWLLSAEIISNAWGSSGSGSAVARSGGLGLSARYYLGKPSDSKGNINRLRFYAETGGSYELRWVRGSDITGQSNKTLNAVVLKAGAGFNYLLNDHVAFETGIGGRDYIFESRDYSQSSIKMQMDLGIRVFLNRRKAKTD